MRGRWGDGVWLGIREETGEAMIGTKEWVMRARAVRRKASNLLELDRPDCWKSKAIDIYNSYHLCVTLSKEVRLTAFCLDYDPEPGYTCRPMDHHTQAPEENGTESVEIAT